jgi:hypothetical protein
VITSSSSSETEAGGEGVDALLLLTTTLAHLGGAEAAANSLIRFIKVGKSRDFTSEWSSNILVIISIE